MSEKFTSASLESLTDDFLVDINSGYLSSFIKLPENNATPGTSLTHLIMSIRTKAEFPYINFYIRDTKSNDGGVAMALTCDQADELATYLQYFAKLGRESGSS